MGRRELEAADQGRRRGVRVWGERDFIPIGCVQSHRIDDERSEIVGPFEF